MQQLSGLDTLFLRLEAGPTYLHVGPVMICAPPASAQGTVLPEVFYGMQK